MSLSISYNGNFNSGVYMIKSGSYIEETNTALTSHLDDDEIMMDLSKLHFHMTGAYYEKQSTSGGLQYIMVYFFNDDGQIIAGTSLNFSKVTKSTAYMSEYLCDQTIDLSTVHRYSAYEDDPIPAKIGFQFEYTYKSGSSTMIDDIQIESANVTGYPYIFPSISAFTMSRALQDETISQQGQFGRYDITSNLAAIAASDEPSFIKSAAALSVSFTRSGTDYSHAADSSGTGLLQSGGSALQLGNEETFTVTATLTDGISTVTMSALLSANFAIFNANAAKTGISFGKYATQAGFDCNMDAEFRHDTEFDGDATFNEIPFILPNMMECLWRKVSPDASMGGNSTFTLSRDLTAGEPVVLVYRMWEQSDAFSNIQTVIGWAGHAVRLFCLATSTTNRNGTRPITIGPRGNYAANTVYFGNCEYNGSTSNNYCVLLAVYAFKREWLNHDDALSEYETANNL